MFLVRFYTKNGNKSLSAIKGKCLEIHKNKGNEKVKILMDGKKYISYNFSILDSDSFKECANVFLNYFYLFEKSYTREDDFFIRTRLE